MATNQVNRLRNIADRLPGLPKVVDPKTHAVLDYLTTGAFFVMAGVFWGRHRRATALALTNGFMVLGLTWMTDYSGRPHESANIRGLLSFKAHRIGDLVQAATAFIGPTLLGFADEGAALPFRLQSGNEVMVIGITDWDKGGQGQLDIGGVREKIRNVAA